LDSEAQGRIAAIAAAADTAWQQGGIAAARAILDGELAVPGPLVIHLAAPGGRRVLGNLPGWPAGVAADGQFYRVPTMHYHQGVSEPFMVVARPMPQGHRLLVGRSLAAEVQLQNKLTTTLLLALPVAMILAFLTSRLITRIITDRVHDLADVVGEVTAGKLEARVVLARRGHRSPTLGAPGVPKCQPASAALEVEVALRGAGYPRSFRIGSCNSFGSNGTDTSR
jgi:hypothetical protein